MQGLIHLDRYELDAAAKHLGRSTSQRFIHFKRAALDSITGLMLAYQTLVREDEARTTLELIREYVSLADDPMLSALMDASEARLAIAQGRLEPVLRWIGTTPSSAEGAMIWWLEIPSVTRCRALIAEGSPAGLKEAQERLCEYVALNEAHHNIYQKLNVRKRREAVEKARKMGIL